MKLGRRSIKDAASQFMDEFLEHMRTRQGEQDFIKFGSMAQRLVGFIEKLPFDESWVYDVLICLSIYKDGPRGAQKLHRGDGLLRDADDSNWDEFCRWMWFYTVPIERANNDVFETIARLRESTRDNVHRLTLLRVLEELCRDFNRQLGWRCAEHARKEHEKLLRTASELQNSLIKTQTELARTKQSLRYAQTELARMHTGTRPDVAPAAMHVLLHQLQSVNEAMYTIQLPSEQVL